MERAQFLVRLYPKFKELPSYLCTVQRKIKFQDMDQKLVIEIEVTVMIHKVSQEDTGGVVLESSKKR